VQSIPVGGTPRISKADMNKPVPRLPDGKVDITGPWLDGGSNDDIERDGGLKPGELPLLPWAKELRDKRLTKDEPYTTMQWRPRAEWEISAKPTHAALISRAQAERILAGVDKANPRPRGPRHRPGS
jgi:hypothetical protein